MLFFLLSFLSLLLITKPLSLRLPSWVDEMRLLFVLLFQELLFHSFQSLQNYKMVTTQILKFPFTMFTNKNGELRIENVEKEEDEEVEMRVLDLPELALDLILEKLSPVGLLNLANVCSSLRERCRSDHLWERHFREKWGRVIGNSARKEWERYSTLKIESKRTGSLRSERPNWWPFKSIKESGVEGKNCESNDSVMAWYMELESGRFWFPAQVYNRENGHAGFMLSCYDAELSYDSRNDTFHARYPPLGQRVTNCEEGVSWERLRVSPVDTPAHDLHISNCLKDLHPGDHIEIQWRRNKEYPYGWWYGMVGHESCDGDELHCRCNNSDTVILEFNQYSPGSIWRKTVIDRKYHREEGNETDGFYGGIRKIYDKNEISMWRRLWPTEVLE